jgi:hypothetical protein
MNERWSDNEVELVVADYFSMLIDERKGIKLNKRQHRMALWPLLHKSRVEGTIEYKHRNISAVLAEMGLPYIKGYLPATHFQKSILVPKVAKYIKMHPDLEMLFADFANDVPAVEKSIELNSLLTEPPEKDEKLDVVKIDRKPIKINYLEREQNNRSLGLKGEELVMQYERFMLSKAGKDNLADSLEWVSRDQGDGLGFDILSRNLNGTDKYIEVKTTKLSQKTPFFFSSNEYKFSLENQENYHLYRLYNFSDKTKMFTLTGSFDDFCHVEPIQYTGKFS